MKDFRAGRPMKTPQGYIAFMPEPINRAYRLDDPKLQGLVEQATLKLGALDAFGELVPNIRHFIRLHVVKEATVSSKIEGTNTNMEEVLMDEHHVDPERRDDRREVNNYVAAMQQSLARMPELPLSSRLLREAHGTLMQGVRGERKTPGEFRRSQNWIGGASLADATFIPPVWEEVNPLMSDLEQLLHSSNTQLPHVLKAALAHYQFETIHPFLDGNGRIGRLMITLYFVHAGILKQPVLYLSDFFERNRSAYYDNLTRVRTHNDLEQWFKFFLVGVIGTADKATNGLREILRLKQDCLEQRIPSIGIRSTSGPRLLEYLFQQPVVNAEMVSEAIGQTPASAYKLIAAFEQVGILREITGSKWGRIYRFEEYFKVFE
ncbi:MAG TPA: Fic family protein [Flavobacteriales bacterium]|nr:Fic family protein [Flavobacteriales bacterium]MCB0807845.1 Fic family protein [Flavobacteriales bacterium]MCB0812481.1 Fic family protein [Flavobacteriales bacterium]HOP43220.1 Fic family protein [Flavobacteriales bacterium]HPQ58566.1 Fic family protein [Flavobacteriales bacterium]